VCSSDLCTVIKDDGHTQLKHLPLHSMPLTPHVLENADLVMVVTDHTDVDYQLVADHAALVLDTRGAMREVSGRATIIGISGAVDAPTEPNGHRPSWTELTTAAPA